MQLYEQLHLQERLTDLQAYKPAPAPAYKPAPAYNTEIIVMLMVFIDLMYYQKMSCQSQPKSYQTYNDRNSIALSASLDIIPSWHALSWNVDQMIRFLNEIRVRNLEEEEETDN